MLLYTASIKKNFGVCMEEKTLINQLCTRYVVTLSWVSKEDRGDSGEDRE